MNPRNTKRTRLISKAMLTGAIVLGTSTLGGCETAGEGLFTGAALGALTGVALGSLSGNAGEGAITGTIIGAAGGAILGDQNRRNREYGSRGNRDYGYGYYDSGRSHRSHRSRRSHHGHHDRVWWEEDWHH
ncbi:MAG: hypothetical protein JKY43_06565 [Phycisphaerales bacterium]|nr:hypothetical protein [Phycisphaerales bacterium]